MRVIAKSTLRSFWSKHKDAQITPHHTTVVCMTVFTFGYEGLDVGEFISCLARHEIGTVVDVREVPLSRKPGFSKKTLAGFLKLAGVGYVHMADLGCPKPVRDRYRADGDWHSYTEGFLQHLGQQDAAIAGLAELAGASRCALVCYEADFNFCHRSLVANALSEYCGVNVSHITAKTTKLKTSSVVPLQLAFF